MVIGRRNIETARASFHVLSYLPYQIDKLINLNTPEQTQ